MNASSLIQLLRAIGPGLLFAGTAIGVSHLVQSTRAGALFGLGLLTVVLLANLTKYPALSIGTRYTNATGLSLLEAYRRQGRWALILYGFLTFGTMFTVVAAVSFVTAALLNEVILRHLAEGISLQMGTVLLLGLVTVLLRVGGFRWLDRAMKALLATMALMTVLATGIAMTKLDWATLSLLPPKAALQSPMSIAFVVALAGWMPAPLDVSVWNSIWSQAHRAEQGRQPSFKEGRFDFNLGYVLCVSLAVCFVILGTVSLYQPGVQAEEGGVAFAGQVVQLFTNALGAWSYPVVGVCCLAVMLSTTLTVVDACPRVLMVMTQRLAEAEDAETAAIDHSKSRLYWIWYAVLMAGTLVVIFVLVKSLSQLVDLATSLSFMTAPVFAWLNHRAIFSEEVTGDYRPGLGFRWFSIAAGFCLLGFSLFFMYSRFVL